MSLRLWPLLSILFTAFVFFVLAAVLVAFYLEHKLESGEDIPHEVTKSRFENVVAILKDVVVTMFTLVSSKVVR